MSKKIINIILSITLFSFILNYYPLNSFAEEKKDSIAILDLVATNISKEEAGMLSDRLRSEILKTGKFEIMEREKIDLILKEQGFQETGLCNTTECSVEVGQLLAVNRIVTGSVGKMGNLYSINLRLLDVQTGKNLKTAEEDCMCPIEDVLLYSIRKVAYKLVDVPYTEPELVKTVNPSLSIGTIKINQQKFDFESMTKSPLEIYFNNKKVGIGTGTSPLEFKNIPIGKYIIEPKKQGFESITKEVTLTEGETIEVALNLNENADLAKIHKKFQDDKDTGSTIKTIWFWSSLGMFLIGGATGTLYFSDGQLLIAMTGNKQTDRLYNWYEYRDFYTNAEKNSSSNYVSSYFYSSISQFTEIYNNEKQEDESESDFGKRKYQEIRNSNDTKNIIWWGIGGLGLIAFVSSFFYNPQLGDYYDEYMKTKNTATSLEVTPFYDGMAVMLNVKW